MKQSLATLFFALFELLGTKKRQSLIRHSMGSYAFKQMIATHEDHSMEKRINMFYTIIIIMYYIVVYNIILGKIQFNYNGD